MMKIVIAYYTGSGHTKKLAEYAKEGALRVDGAHVDLVNVENLTDVPWDLFHRADAIIFGSPTYMGSVAGQFKSFMDETSNFWIEQHWANKIAAGFTIGASASGDKLNSLIQLSVFAAQHGMIWAGQNHIGSKHTKDDLAINDAGSWLGLMAVSDADKVQLMPKSDIRTAHMFGERVARVTRRWNKGGET